MAIYKGFENREYPENSKLNSMFGMSQRKCGQTIFKEFHIMANNETKHINILRFVGSIYIISQYAFITEVTTCASMTNVYVDIWDGTNSKLLTKDTADFSNLCNGSFFSKLGLTSEEFVCHIASENRVTDLKIEDLGQPFLITAKYGVDNYIRFNFTTDNMLDFKMLLFFSYLKLDTCYLEFI